MTDFEQLFGSHRVMVILRGPASATDAVNAAHRAWDAGVHLVEVPIGEPDQVAYLAAVVDAGRERGKHVGAGAVITAEQVRAAVAAGAVYTVAPGLDPAVLDLSRAAGLPHLPGVATPTEVQRAAGLGCRWVKVFPASTLGPDWFAQIRGPFPHMRCLATGGLTMDNAASYLAAGARIAAFGMGVVAPDRYPRFVEFMRGMDAGEQ